MSLTIDHDTPQVMEIAGLSMAARAQLVVDPAEAEKLFRPFSQADTSATRRFGFREGDLRRSHGLQATSLQLAQAQAQAG